MSNWHPAVVRMQQWYKEGKPMPGYVMANGAPYIAYLLGLKSDPSPNFSIDSQAMVYNHNPKISGNR